MYADSKTEGEIVAILDRFGEAFGSKDPEGILALLSNDSDLSVIGSEDEWATGPLEVRELVAQLFAQDHHYSWTWNSRKVSAAGPVAWVVADAFLNVRTGAGELSLPYRMTGIFEKRGDRWLWTHYHGSEPVRVPSEQS